jgi:SNF2 family DNA or RNA helicase
MKGTLQPHQAHAKKKIETVKKQLLYHGLGSGKTLTALASREGKTTVITPASHRTNIKDTVKKFGLPGKGIEVYSFEGAVKKKLSGDTLIVDEAHRLGVAGTKRSDHIKRMAKNYDRVILLTGSPVRNKPHEIGPLASMLGIDSGDVPSTPGDFDSKFIKLEKDKRSVLDFIRGIKAGSRKVIKNKDKLKKAFSGKVDYYTPERTNFPSVIHKEVKVDMSPDQKRLYDTLVKKTSNDVVYKVRSDRPMTESEKSKANAFLSAARLLSNSGAPFGGEKYTPKINKIVSNIASNQDQNHVVYSSFLDGGIVPIADKLNKKNVKLKMFHGGMNDKEKKEAIDAFNSGKINTLLISGAGAEGIDLKGTRNIHITEPHWNEARVDQVIGRGVRFKSHNHLPEKDRNVTVTKYYSTVPKKGFLAKMFSGKDRDTGADEYMAGLARQKQRLNEQVLDILKQSSGTKRKRIIKNG